MRQIEVCSATPLLTVNEVAQLLRMKPPVVYRAANSGELPCYRLGRCLRFSRGDVDRWLEARKEGSFDA